MKNDTRLLIFAKAPIPGQCKTRLIPALGESAATQLHQELTDLTLKKFALDPLYQCELWCTPDTQHPYFIEQATHYGMDLFVQTGNNLGERMANGAQRALNTSARALIIGTDCPGLSHSHIHAVIDDLRSDYMASIIPAEDGGYVLIGLRCYDSSLFKQITWGSTIVMEETSYRLESLGWRWRQHEPLADIDRPEDIADGSQYSVRCSSDSRV